MTIEHGYRCDAPGCGDKIKALDEDDWCWRDGDRRYHSGCCTATGEPMDDRGDSAMNRAARLMLMTGVPAAVVLKHDFPGGTVAGLEEELRARLPADSTIEIGKPRTLRARTALGLVRATW